jgi:hypothetical protein
MKRVEPKLIAWLRLSIATFLGLVAINLGLPALLLLLQIPSFVIGGDELWLLQWQNDKTGSNLQFNLLPLCIIAIALSIIIILIKDRKNR